MLGVPSCTYMVHLGVVVIMRAFALVGGLRCGGGVRRGLLTLSATASQASPGGVPRVRKASKSTERILYKTGKAKAVYSGVGEAAPSYGGEPRALSGLPDGSEGPYLMLGIETSCDDTACAVVRSRAATGRFHCPLPALSVFRDQIGLKKTASTLGETLRRDDHRGDP